MNGHIDADGLAEYRVGLITGRQRRQIAAHLATCAQCASVGDRLAEVSALLAAVPLQTVPDTLAARLQAALDAEIATPAEQTVDSPPRPRFTWPRLSPIRVLAPVAAVAVLAVVGIGLSRLGGSGAPASGSSSAAAAAPAASPLEEGPAAQHHSDGLSVGEGSLSIADSGTDLKPATLGDQLQTLLRAQSKLRTTPASIAAGACVRAVAAGSTVKLAASARYLGSPATIVIVDHGTSYEGFVAGVRCSATDRDILASAVLSSGISAP